ncbi:acetyl-CoA carboxylase biotin carboxyl carrier protein subunit [Amaricoccus sp.]|uniref:acetyl-CoA carboxylase biotin carboxyl carrier protein n=1 Tax=Amaricoccus sp. TaxID=1872485 RepID=UPI001B5E5B8C|nr:acetyl-CoA carboxylase biotin carboxyl carrier protein subunit [Amaricoccus sp.]MBP7241831.1 acetyl-CoA carboxylase biotin carboxyl carrier protein subunit [Amaricoccus sp.]
MRPGEMADLAAAMIAAGIARLELIGPDFRLALARGEAAPEETDETAGGTEAAAETDADVIPVTAPALGMLLRAHPLHERPLAGDGEAVVAGQAIALLRIGALMTPVAAPANGVIVAALAEEGALVGYGDRLFDFLPHD